MSNGKPRKGKNKGKSSVVHNIKREHRRVVPPWHQNDEEPSNNKNKIDTRNLPSAPKKKLNIENYQADESESDDSSEFSFGNYLSKPNVKKKNKTEEKEKAENEFEILSPVNKIIYDYKKICNSRKLSKNIPKLKPETVRSSHAKNVYWIGKIIELWESDQKRDFDESALALFNDCFEDVENPYSTALYFFQNANQASTKPQKKHQLSVLLVRLFEIWITKRRSIYFDKVDSAIQEEAFLFAVKLCSTTLQKVIRSFEMGNGRNKFLIPHINTMLKEEKYVDAAFSINFLGLSSCYNIMEVCLPLLCQDKINVIEKYCAKNKCLQQQFLDFIDKLCDPRVTAFYIPTSLCIKDTAKSDRMESKSLIKLATRLAKLFDVDVNRCQNIINASKLKAVGYLIYRFYVEKSLPSITNFRDLCESTLDHPSEYLKEDFIWKISYYNRHEAAFWARKLNLSPKKVPQPVRHSMENVGNDYELEIANAGDNDSRVNESYLTLRISTDKVEFIENKTQFDNAIKILSVENNIIGIDAEWKPTLTFSGSTSRMALLQLALVDRVFLFDMLKLVDCLCDESWLEFSKKIFCNEETIKLGFSISGDFSMLAQTIPILKDDLSNSKNVVDILNLRNSIVKVEPEFFVQPLSSNYKNLKGLSELTSIVLGKPLNKNEQASNWEKRPLTAKQKYYAALDAHCLIDIYIGLKAACKGKKMDFESLQMTSIFKFDAYKKSKSERSRERFRQHSKPKPDLSCQTNFDEFKRPSEFQFVVDTMLAGLGKELRKIGVDTAIAEQNTTNQNDCASIAIRENRIALTSGNPFHTLQAQLGENYVYNVATSRVCDQIKQVVDHFKITVSINDIFSRCLLCNSDKYLFVNSEQLIKAKILYEDREVKKCYNRRKGIVNSNVRTKKEIDKYAIDVKYDEIDYDLLCVGNGVPIQLESLTMKRLERIQQFYICCTCGKIYWEGLHYEDSCARFSDILDICD